VCFQLYVTIERAFICACATHERIGPLLSNIGFDASLCRWQLQAIPGDFSERCVVKKKLC
jgi:hypothetical protein